MTTQQPETLRLATASNAMADEGEMIHLLSWHEIRNLLRANAAELRRQHARIAELEAKLESIGAASAGSEAVAWLVCTEEGDPDMVFLSQHEAQQYLEDDERPTPLYAHHSPTEGMVGGWIALPGALPEPGVPVLLDIGEKYPIRAMWAAKHTLEVGMEDDSGFGEYDEATDTYYCPEGWYEWNEHEETHWAVDKTPRAWAPLPPTTSAGSGKGE